MALGTAKLLEKRLLTLRNEGEDAEEIIPVSIYISGVSGVFMESNGEQRVRSFGRCF